MMTSDKTDDYGGDNDVWITARCLRRLRKRSDALLQLLDGSKKIACV
jgi:hypothetical protein